MFETDHFRRSLTVAAFLIIPVLVLFLAVYNGDGVSMSIADGRPFAPTSTKAGTVAPRSRSDRLRRRPQVRAPAQQLEDALDAGVPAGDVERRPSPTQGGGVLLRAGPQEDAEDLEVIALGGW